MGFRETLEHKNVVFNDNGTVTALLHHPLTYVPEMSNGTEEDIMILPNIALLVSGMVDLDKSFCLAWLLLLIADGKFELEPVHRLPRGERDQLSKNLLQLKKMWTNDVKIGKKLETRHVSFYEFELL